MFERDPLVAAHAAADKVCVVAEALGQLPAGVAARATRADAAEAERIVVRTDAAGAAHELVEACCEIGLRLFVGSPIAEPLRERVIALKPWRWRRVLEADGSARDGAWVAELPASAVPAGWARRSAVARPQGAAAPESAALLSPTSTGIVSSSS